jgi:hypothetical protein
MAFFSNPWVEHSPHRYNWANGMTAAMADGLERDIELLEIQEVSAWRQQACSRRGRWGWWVPWWPSDDWRGTGCPGP